MQDATAEQIDALIARWETSAGHERGSCQQFLLEFCELLGLEKPSPPVAENERNGCLREPRTPEEARRLVRPELDRPPMSKETGIIEN